MRDGDTSGSKYRRRRVRNGVKGERGDAGGEKCVAVRVLVDLRCLS